MQNVTQVRLSEGALGFSLVLFTSSGSSDHGPFGSTVAEAQQRAIEYGCPADVPWTVRTADGSYRTI
jgi:hypothetical protein